VPFFRSSALDSNRMPKTSKIEPDKSNPFFYAFSRDRLQAIR
jgi:hypothetical protein